MTTAAGTRPPRKPRRPRVPLPRQRGGPHEDKTKRPPRRRKHRKHDRDPPDATAPKTGVPAGPPAP